MDAQKTTMVTFIVRLKFSQDDRPQVAEFLRSLATASRLEPGCVTYIPHVVEDDPDTVLIYEQYKDRAALEAHRATKHFKQYAIGGIYQLMRERLVENLTALA